MCDPVREHRFRSCHTIYSVHLSMGDILDHPTLRRRVRALRRLRRTLTLRQLGAGEHPCDHQTISKSPSHTYYTGPCHCPATLLSMQHLLQSSLNSLSCIFFSAPFFSTGASPSHIPRATHRENNNYGKQRAQIIRRMLAIIQSQSTTNGTSLAVLMLPAGNSG